MMNGEEHASVKGPLTHKSIEVVEFEAYVAVCAELVNMRSELQRERRKVERLRECLFWFEVNSYDKRDAEKAGQFWREFVAIDKESEGAR